MSLKEFLRRERPRFKSGFLTFGLLTALWGGWVGWSQRPTYPLVSAVLLFAGLGTIGAAIWLTERTCQRIAIVLLCCGALLALGNLIRSI